MRQRHRAVFALVGLAMGIAILGSAGAGCSGRGSSNSPGRGSGTAAPVPAQNTPARSDEPAQSKGVLVTFVELGSDKCVPCIMMRPVMEAIEEQYGDQVRVVFHDVWTPAGEPYARQFRVRVIPTQVFLDAQGQEYYRHEGYFPVEQVVEILALKGVKRR